MDKKTIDKYLEIVDRYLKRCLKPTGGMAKTLEKAMYYAVFPGGKRIRPLLTIAVAKIVGVPLKKILPCACGIELIHSFSLIHDDLPCMDNDDFRRGKPSCHKKFGEAQALLAGDALLCLGLREISKCGIPEATIKACDALGSDGMAGGQSLDMIFKGKTIPHKTKIWIDRKKTGELFSLCFEIPAMIGKSEEKTLKRMKTIGTLFGTAFQILDDLYDEEGNEEKLKKQLKKTLDILVEKTENFGEKARLLLTLTGMIFGDFVTNHKL
ncbi:MAG: polyprenyl synthetase family protein [Candidatus Omnitrophica bacterium]|nr:polyprenyl synthetase family protein [Candidatus Omnitrophota bacterium]